MKTYFKELRKKLIRWKEEFKRHRIVVNYPHELAILGIMKNEAMNVDEWVEHYIAVGADHIFLIDNGSTDDTVARVQRWVDKGVVSLIQRPQKYQQIRHYWAAIKHFKIRKLYRWLIIADLDEFWFCPDGSSIREKLHGNATDDVIYANWRMFGSSGLIKHPASIRVSLIHCEPNLHFNCTTKYICRTRVLKTHRNLRIHKIKGADSARVMADNLNFHLNHYAVQSREYFETVKMTRGDVHRRKHDTTRNMDYFEKYDAPCTQENRILADMVTSGRLGKGKT